MPPLTLSDSLTSPKTGPECNPLLAVELGGGNEGESTIIVDRIAESGGTWGEEREARCYFIGVSVQLR